MARHILLARDGLSLQGSKLNPCNIQHPWPWELSFWFSPCVISGHNLKRWIYHSVCSEQDARLLQRLLWWSNKQTRQPHVHAEKGYAPPSFLPLSHSTCVPTAVWPLHLHIPVTGDCWRHRRKFLHSISTAREMHEFWMCSKHAYTPYPFSLVPTASHSLRSPLSSSTLWTDDRINTPSLCDSIWQ